MKLYSPRLPVRSTAMTVTSPAVRAEESRPALSREAIEQIITYFLQAVRNLEGQFDEEYDCGVASAFITDGDGNRVPVERVDLVFDDLPYVTSADDDNEIELAGPGDITIEMPTALGGDGLDYFQSLTNPAAYIFLVKEDGRTLLKYTIQSQNIENEFILSIYKDPRTNQIEKVSICNATAKDHDLDFELFHLASGGLEYSFILDNDFPGQIRGTSQQNL